MWINGFWSEGFWNTGFWEGDAPILPPVEGPLSPLAVAVQGIGFTPVLVAVQGLLAFLEEGGTTRRPKANSNLKLQKIKEGRAWLVHAKSETRARTLRADGFTPPVVAQPTLPGAVRALGCKSAVRAKVVRSKAHAAVQLRRYTADTHGTPVQASTAGTATLVQVTADTNANALRAVGLATIGLLSSSAATTCERLHARGARGVSDIEIVAALRVVDIRR